MFWTILVLLVGLWLLAMGTSHRLGGLIHALPALAVVLLVVRLASGTLEATQGESGRLYRGNDKTAAGL